MIKTRIVAKGGRRGDTFLAAGEGIGGAGSPVYAVKGPASALERRGLLILPDVGDLLLSVA